MKLFTELFDDCTSQGTKIKTDEYLESGTYAVVDQGQSDIAGYTNIEDGVYTDVPAIIFGDHTRAIKYIEVPFFLGADGVKLLKAKDKNANYKYLYYALKNARIPNTGYNRHFKWLKEVKIQCPDINKQKKIVSVLEKIELIIAERKQQLQQLDLLIKARFVEMFGDPVINPKKWNVKSVIDVCDCMVPGRDKPKSFTGEIPWITIDDLMVNSTTFRSKQGLGLTEDEIKEVKRTAIPTGSVVMSCVGNLGICSIAGTQMIINQQLHSFQCHEGINNVFLMYYLGQRKDYMEQQASSTTVLYMNKSVCNSIPVMIPNMELQEQFAEFITQVDKSKVVVQKSLDETQQLFDSLMQQYFG